MIEFSSSAALYDYVMQHNTYKRVSPSYSIGSLRFIDSPTLHIVFHSRSESEAWKRGVDSQICLF